MVPQGNSCHSCWGMALRTPTARLSSTVTWWLPRIALPPLLPVLTMLCLASMGEMGREELWRQPGRVGAGPQPPNVTPFSCEYPFPISKTLARTQHLEEGKPSCLLHALLVSKRESSELALFLLRGHKDKFVHRQLQAAVACLHSQA